MTYTTAEVKERLNVLAAVIYNADHQIYWAKTGRRLPMGSEDNTTVRYESLIDYINGNPETHIVLSNVDYAVTINEYDVDECRVIFELEPVRTRMESRYFLVDGDGTDFLFNSFREVEFTQRVITSWNDVE